MEQINGMLTSEEIGIARRALDTALRLERRR